MNSLSMVDLRVLLAPRPGRCLSLFLPTLPAGADPKQNQVAMKNLLRRAEEALTAHGVPEAEQHSLLAPLRELRANLEFWHHAQDGLALFRGNDVFYAFQLPISVPEQITIGQSFTLRPLVPLLSGDGTFYVLALSKNQLRLLRGSRSELVAVPLPGAPASLADTLRFDEYQKQFQFHPGLPGPGGSKGSVIRHGQGASSDVAEGQLQRYVQQIARSVHLARRTALGPLVLACTEELFGLYGATTGERTFHLPGTPDSLSSAELHKRAWPMVQPLFLQAEHDAATSYDQLRHTQPALAAATAREIVPAALAGRVRYLFVSPSPPLWGYVDPGSGHVSLHESPLPGDRDMVDLAVTAVLRHHHPVFPLRAAALAEAGPMVAVLYA